MVTINKAALKSTLMDEYTETMVGMDIDVTLAIRQLMIKHDIVEDEVRDFFISHIDSPYSLLKLEGVEVDWQKELCTVLTEVMNKYEPAMEMVEIAISSARQRLDDGVIQEDSQAWDDYLNA